MVPFIPNPTQSFPECISALLGTGMTHQGQTMAVASSGPHDSLGATPQGSAAG